MARIRTNGLSTVLAGTCENSTQAISSSKDVITNIILINCAIKCVIIQVMVMPRTVCCDPEHHMAGVKPIKTPIILRGFDSILVQRPFSACTL